MISEQLQEMPSNDLMDLEQYQSSLEEIIEQRNPGTNRFSFVRNSFSAGDREAEQAEPLFTVEETKENKLDESQEYYDD